MRIGDVVLTFNGRRVSSQYRGIIIAHLSGLFEWTVLWLVNPTQQWFIDERMTVQLVPWEQL